MSSSSAAQAKAAEVDDEANLATPINGTAAAKALRASLKEEVERLRVAFPGQTPKLVIVQVGGREDSAVYIRMKVKAGAEIGVDVVHEHLPSSSSKADILGLLRRLNEDSKVHGIIVQMPLDMDQCEGGEDPAEVEEEITDAVDPLKDVDGFHTYNIGLLAKKRTSRVLHLVACTPRGCIHLLEEVAKVDLCGKNVVVIGRSNIVGRPMAQLCLRRNATVTVAHSRTADLPGLCRTADVLIVAVGRARMVQADWVKPGAVVIDCGINSIEDKTRKSGRRLVGDVDYANVRRVASAITPVPGGVGPMTVALLLKNTVNAFRYTLEGAGAPMGGGAAAAAATTAAAAATTTRDPLAWAQTRMRVLPLDLKQPVPSDIEVAMAQTPKPITTVASEVGVTDDELSPYGRHMAKVDGAAVLRRLVGRGAGKYVVVTGCTPTPLGEGKSTTTVGLCQALGATLRRNVFACLRQPSQGPTFGIKGGAAGGGYSQVIPMDEFNLHMTGDLHAITAANNLVAAAIDARILHEATQKDEALTKRLVPEGAPGAAPGTPLGATLARRAARLGFSAEQIADASALSLEDKVKLARLNIDPETITFRRVIDTNDRFLRAVTVGQSMTEGGKPGREHLARRTQFDITVASELMAVLALCDSVEDFRARVARIVVANDRDGRPVTCDDLGVTGAVAVLMQKSVSPTLMQTLEGTPVFVHAGPFANIAHGNSSIVADKVAAKLVGPRGLVVTEAGFGADIGMEKFFNIKCRASGMVPDAVVLVCTIRAVKMHGGGPAVKAGTPLAKEYKEENIELVAAGACNIVRHVENAVKFGVPVVVAINTFPTDTQAEIAELAKQCVAAGAEAAIPCFHHAKGGEGAKDLATEVVRMCFAGDGESSGASSGASSGGAAAASAEEVKVDVGEESKAEAAAAAAATAGAAQKGGGNFQYLYPDDMSLREKIEKICVDIYRADGVE